MVQQIEITNKPEKTVRNKLNIIVWNIRGLHDKIMDPDLQQFLFKNDVIVLTETHTSKWAKSNYNIVPGFLYRDFPRNFIHPNAPGPSGGIGIFYRSNLSDGIEFESTDESVVWIKLRSTFFAWESDKLIGCIYFSPQDSSYLHSTPARTDYFDILNEQIARHENYSDIYLCGDLNARTGQLVDYPETIPGTNGDLSNLQCPFILTHNTSQIMMRTSRDTTVNEYGKCLINVCKSTGFRIMNGRLGNKTNSEDFTCYKGNGASVVDYLLCRPDSIPSIDEFTISPKRSESDHRPLHFTLCVPNTAEYLICDNVNNTGEKLLTYRWNRNKLAIYQEQFRGTQYQELKDQLSLKVTDQNVSSDKLCDVFYGFLNTSISHVSRLRSNTAKSHFPVNKWFDENCKQLKKQVNEYAKMYDITRSPDAETYQELEMHYRRMRQNCKRQYRDNIRMQLDNLHSSNPSDYWKLWKSFRPHKVNNSKLTLNDFNSYFKGQTRPPDVGYHDILAMNEVAEFLDKYHTVTDYHTPNSTLSDDICNSPITEEEIKTHLRKLKNRKAAGADGIPGEFLKYAADELCDPLLLIYNSIFDRGDWPTKWSEGIISPIHKKASINDPDNYRKITVMSALGKVLESILNARLAFRNIALDMDDPYQFGFKENARTTDNIFILQSIILRQRFKSKPLYKCFVDFTKAFDFVNRSALYLKLKKRGIHGKLLSVIRDMYDKAVCRVKWKGALGEVIDSEYGVLQGGMLSPKLFTEFLTDLKDFLETKSGLVIDDTIMTYILYADDLVLCSDSPSGLQTLIDGLFEFCSKWHLIVSLAKTNVLIFGKNKHHEKFIFNDEEIKITDCYKYLGTVISSSSHDIYKKNYPHLAEKARNAIFALQTYTENNVGYLYPRQAFKMFDVQISPILEYASEVWFCNKENSELEKIHLGYLKSVLKIKSTSSTLALYAECGRFPIIVKQKFQAIKFWQRITKLDDRLHQQGQIN